MWHFWHVRKDFDHKKIRIFWETLQECFEEKNKMNLIFHCPLFRKIWLFTCFSPLFWVFSVFHVDHRKCFISRTFHSLHPAHIILFWLWALLPRPKTRSNGSKPGFKNPIETSAVITYRNFNTRTHPQTQFYGRGKGRSRIISSEAFEGRIWNQQAFPSFWALSPKVDSTSKSRQQQGGLLLLRRPSWTRNRFPSFRLGSSSSSSSPSSRKK